MKLFDNVLNNLNDAIELYVLIVSGSLCICVEIATSAIMLV